MLYESTRGKAETVNAARAVVIGIAGDGGLFVPQNIPKADFSIESLIGLDYQETARKVMRPFFPDFEEENFSAAVRRAYSGRFENDAPAVIRHAGGLEILELFHGPTLAFKDMALSFLPELMRLSLDSEGASGKIAVITATSGDTGKAALEGFRDREGISVTVFYPRDGVSEIQRLQMATDTGTGSFVCAVEGNFDDTQNGVKAIFNDREFSDKLRENGYILSSANSINIGRLVPQVAYYFYGYARLASQGRIKSGDRINITVPTGNFGNILAAYYAKQMGLPVDRLICASNINNVLYDFFKSGSYDKNRPLHLTTSPSMDILVSSNLERLLYEASGRNPEVTAGLMSALAEKGAYSVPDEMRENLKDFYGVYADESDVQSEIKAFFQESGYVLDTHTAVAVFAAKKYKKETGDGGVNLVVSTASPFKFGEAVCKALGFDTAGLNVFEISELLSEKTGLAVPENLRGLKNAEIRFRRTCPKDGMKKAFADFLGL
ncbi:MAG: threonine synthase [Oscillospiraceae bacterium]|jgi:threonine synthase|nr:threonine synthase [Oscillospiraceae bacterium]